MAPSSRFAASSKPNVAYLEPNLSALLKKQTTLPSLAYAGIPYQVFGASPGALAVTIPWSRSAMTRSDSGISAIFASTSLSPSAADLADFRSRARSFIAARSSAVNPPDPLPAVAVFFAGLRAVFFADFRSAICQAPPCAECVTERGVVADVHDAQGIRGSRPALLGRSSGAGLVAVLLVVPVALVLARTVRVAAPGGGPDRRRRLDRRRHLVERGDD